MEVRPDGMAYGLKKLKAEKDFFSIKVKRLFMYIGEKQGHSWISDLEPSRINFGKGKRMIVPNGRYDTKYLITVPQEYYGEVP